MSLCTVFVLVCVQFRNFKIVYRRYAGLYFCICVDITDNNLAYLEAIHNFVEVLNEYFHNVCELDLVFNFYKVTTTDNLSSFVNNIAVPNTTYTHIHTAVLWLSGFCLRQPGWASTRRNIHPLTPHVVINHPLSVSSIYYDP